MFGGQRRDGQRRDGQRFGGRDEARPARVLTGVFWLAATGAVAMTLAVRSTTLLPGEVTVMHWVRAHLSRAFGLAGPVLDVAFTGWIPLVIFLVLTLALLWRWGRYPAAMFFVAGSLTGLTKLADLARRPRPTDDLTWGQVVVGEGGYPSGHVVYTVMIFGMLAHLALHHVRLPALRHLTRVGAVVLIAVTGPSRLVEIDHWPADVVAGYLIATVGLTGMIWIERRIPRVLLVRAPRVHGWLHHPRRV